jgi:hypothetical protein
MSLIELEDNRRDLTVRMSRLTPDLVDYLEVERMSPVEEGLTWLAIRTPFLKLRVWLSDSLTLSGIDSSSSSSSRIESLIARNYL